MKLKFLLIVLSLLLLFTITSAPEVSAVGQTCCNATYSVCANGDPICTYSFATFLSDDALCPQNKNINSFAKACLYRSTWAFGGAITCGAGDPACSTFIHACDLNPAKHPWNCNPGELCNVNKMECVLEQEVINPQNPRVGSQCPVGDISTGIGCIHTAPDLFIGQVLQVGIGIGSGVAFLLILLGSFKMMTSQGNPEGINHGKDQITSAIIGLVFIILSITILEIIGFDILGLGLAGLGTR
ncbi:MAG: pilin [bacterium]|nr:pilin [bacterium]